MKPISSATTGMAVRAQRAASANGGQPGATGSAITLSADPSREMHPEVTARLPSANTGAALSRMQQCGVHCSVSMETVFPTTPDGDTTFRQRPTSLKVNIDSSGDLEGALKVINAALLPASSEQIEEWLAVLSVLAAPRKESANRAELTLVTYTSRLKQYPADVVRHVLTNYRSTWFPTWNELVERLDEMTEPRLMVRDRLVDMINGKDRPAIESKPKSARLDDLRAELAAHNKNLLRFPELAGPEADERRERILDEIQQLEGQG